MPRRTRRFCAHFLRLENRITPALTTSFSQVTGLLTVTSDADDAIVLRGGGLSGDDRVFLNDVPILDGAGLAVRIQAVSSVEVNGGPGANVIDVSQTIIDSRDGVVALDIRVDDESIGARISGSGGDDTITGSLGCDFIDGGAGADLIVAGLGDDIIITDTADAPIDGGDGFDRVEFKLPPGEGATLADVYDRTLHQFTLTYAGGAVVFNAAEEVFVDCDGQATAVTSASLPAGTATSMTAEVIEDIEYDIAGRKRDNNNCQSVKRTGAQPAGRFVRTLYDKIAGGSLALQGTAGGDAITVMPGFVPVTLIGAQGADTIDVTPGPWPVTALGGDGADLLSVNHGGYEFKQSTGTFEVTTKAPVSFGGIENVQPVHTLFGDDAMEHFRKDGAVIFCDYDAKELQRLTITIDNKAGTTPITDLSLDFGRVPGFLEAAGSPGVTWTIQSVAQTVPTELQVLGVPADIPTVVAEIATVPAGQSATLTLRRAVEGSMITVELIYETAIEPTLRFTRQVIGGATSIKFHNLIMNGSGDRVRPVSTDPTTGKTAAGASEAVGATALGVPLILSTAPDIDPDVTSVSPGTHIYLGDMLIDAAPGGTKSGNGKSYDPYVSAGGRYVWFMTEATDLVPGFSDTNGLPDFVVRDNWLQTASYVKYNSTRSATVECKVDHFRVYFTSPTPDVVPGLSDTNGADDLFVYDIPTGMIECLSLNADKTATANKGVLDFAVTYDGQTALYVTTATDLVTGGNPAGASLVRRGNGGAAFAHSMGNVTLAGACFDTSLAFSSDADLSALTGVPDTNGVSDLFVWAPATGKVVAVSVNSSKDGMGDGETTLGGSSPTWFAFAPYASLVVRSDATNLVSGAAQAKGGVYRFIFDPVADAYSTERIDKRAGGGYGGGNGELSVSPDGRFVAFTSLTDYSSPTGTLPHKGVWLVNTSAEVIRVDVLPDGKAADGPASRPLVGVDSDVLFTSAATNLVPDDGNGAADAFAARAVGYIQNYQCVVSCPDTTLRRNGANYEIVDNLSGLPLQSWPVATTRRLFIHGVDNSADRLTVDFGSGLSGLDEVYFEGGVGAGDNLVAKAFDQKRYDFHTKGEFVLFRTAAGGPFVVSDDVEEVGLVKSGLDHAFVLIGDLSGSDGDYQVTVTDAPGTGTTQIDVAQKGVSNPRKIVFYDAFVELTLRTGSGDDTVTVEGVDPSVPGSAKTTIDAGDGNDTIDASKFTRPLTLLGGLGNDNLTGGKGADTIDAGVGTNSIRLNGPGECVCPDGYYENTVEGSAGLRVSFDGRDGGVDIDLTSMALQKIAPASHLQFKTLPSKVTGSQSGDTFRFRAVGGLSSESEVVDYREGGLNDSLIIDAQGKVLTDLGGRVVGGDGPLVYSGIEGVTVNNKAPGNQFVALQVNDGSAQRSRVTSLRLGFSTAITFTSLPENAVVLLNQTTSTTYPVTVSTQEINGFTNVLLSFSGAGIVGNSLPDGKYKLTIISTGITGGLAGGDAVANFHRLFGDADGDADVDVQDFGAFRGVFGTASNLAFDFDGDGDVDVADFGAFRARFGVSV